MFGRQPQLFGMKSVRKESLHVNLPTSAVSIVQGIAKRFNGVVHDPTGTKEEKSMLKEKRLLLVGVVSIILLISLSIGFKGRGQTGQVNQPGAAVTSQAQSGQSAKELDDIATPMVDLNNSTPITSDRILKNARYDKRPIIKSEIDPGADEVRIHDSIGISDIPSDESDLVVEGEITDSAAFLSNDKGMVYSEFSVHVTEILKMASGLGGIANVIVAERFGGRVRYPDGRIIRYRLAGQGSPERGKRYLLFLSKSGLGNYTLLTAYELNGNKILALDGSRINDRGLGNTVFDKHNGEDYQRLRTAVEKAIKNPRSGVGDRRSTP